MFALVKRGFRESEVLVICSAGEPAHRVLFPIRECSVFRHKSRPSIYEMEKMALIVTPRGPKHAALHSGANSETHKAEVELILEEKT